MDYGERGERWWREARTRIARWRLATRRQAQTVHGAGRSGQQGHIVARRGGGQGRVRRAQTTRSRPGWTARSREMESIKVADTLDRGKCRSLEGLARASREFRGEPRRTCAEDDVFGSQDAACFLGRWATVGHPGRHAGPGDAATRIQAGPYLAICLPFQDFQERCECALAGSLRSAGPPQFFEGRHVCTVPR